MSGWEAVVGLEIHVQLATASKLFGPAPVAFGGEPNTRVDEVCSGQPGTLPVPNARAIELAVRGALALGCTIRQRSVFSRKHYIYPDLPRGYQITQFEHPVAVDGRVEIEVDGRRTVVRIERAHIEEDAGKSMHDGREPVSRIDLNRAGTALIEVVTHPDLSSGAEAAACFRAVRELVVAAGACDGNLEEGSMRCDGNVSVRRPGAALGTKVEVKNLNSFRFLRDAVDHEIARQTAVLEAGGTIAAETRLWDERAQRTFVMRRKEGAADYRYMPEPDLPPLVLDPDDIEAQRAALGELPPAARHRLAHDEELGAYDASVIVDGGWLGLYDAARGSGAAPRTLAKLVSGPLARAVNDGTAQLEGAVLRGAGGSLDGTALAGLAALVDDGTLSMGLARDVADDMLATGETADAVVARRGLAAERSVDALTAVVAEVLAAFPDEASRLRGGDARLIGFFIGHAMRRTGGTADAATLRGLLVAQQTEDP